LFAARLQTRSNTGFTAAFGVKQWEKSVKLECWHGFCK